MIVTEVGGLDVTHITFFRVSSGKIPECDKETVADAVKQVKEKGYTPASIDLAEQLVLHRTRADLPEEVRNGESRVVILFEADVYGTHFVALEPNDVNIYHGEMRFPGSKFVPVFLACVQEMKKEITKVA